MRALLILSFLCLIVLGTKLTTNPFVVPAGGGFYYSEKKSSLPNEIFIMMSKPDNTAIAPSIVAESSIGRIALIDTGKIQLETFVAACPWRIQNTPPTDNITISVQMPPQSDLSVWRISGSTRSSRGNVTGPLEDGEVRAVTLCRDVFISYYFELLPSHNGFLTVYVSPTNPDDIVYDGMSIQVHGNQNTSSDTCGDNGLIASYKFTSYKNGRSFTGLAPGTYLISTGYPSNVETGRAPISVGACAGSLCAMDVFDATNIPLNLVLCNGFKDFGADDSSSPSSSLGLSLSYIF